MDEREVRERIEEVLAGEGQSFEPIVHALTPALFNLASKMAGPGTEPSDIVQETFLRAYRDLGRYDGRAAFSSWLYGICVNVSYDAGKRRKRAWAREKPLGEEEATIANPAPGAEAVLMARQDEGRLRECLGRLPETLRSALLLRYQEDLPLEAVARSLRIGLSAAKMRIQRGLEQLRGLCGNGAPGGTP